MAPIAPKWRRILNGAAVMAVALICLDNWLHHRDLVAAIEGRSRIWLATYLICGANPNRVGADGQTPLGCAVGLQDDTATAWLLRKGADPDLPQPGGRFEGRRPLGMAVDLGFPSVTSLLLHGGADPNLPDADGTAPLHRIRDVAAARELLDGGAHPDAQDAEGRTILSIATQAGERKVIRLLLARGADPTIPDANGNPPAEIAEMVGRPELYRLLCGATAAWERERAPIPPPVESAAERTESAAPESGAPESADPYRWALGQ